MAKRLVEIPVSGKTKQKIGKLLKELQAKGENVKNENDVISYLLKNAKPLMPFCIHCGGPLKKRKFVDSWDTKTGEAEDVNEDLYCPKCDIRWSPESGPHQFLEDWKPEEHKRSIGK